MPLKNNVVEASRLVSTKTLLLKHDCRRRGSFFCGSIRANRPASLQSAGPSTVSSDSFSLALHGRSSLLFLMLLGTSLPRGAY